MLYSKPLPRGKKTTKQTNKQTKNTNSVDPHEHYFNLKRASAVEISILPVRTMGKVFDQENPAKVLTRRGTVWEVKYCVSA